MRDVIAIDSGSSIPGGSFCNADLMANIGPSKEPINMLTNKGEGELNMEGATAGLGSVYHDPDGIANVISLSWLAKQPGYRVVLDSAKENAIKVYRDEKLFLEFPCTPEGLYTYKLDDDYFRKIDKLK